MTLEICVCRGHSRISLPSMPPGGEPAQERDARAKAYPSVSLTDHRLSEPMMESKKIRLCHSNRPSKIISATSSTGLPTLILTIEEMFK